MDVEHSEVDGAMVILICQLHAPNGPTNHGSVTKRDPLHYDGFL